MATNDDLRAAQNAIAAALSQHAAYQHRASSAVVNAVNKGVHGLALELAAAIQPILETLNAREIGMFLAGDYGTARLRKLRDAIEAFGAGSGEVLSQQWAETAPKLAAYEAGYAAALMDQVVDGVPKLQIDGPAVYSQAMRTPMSGGAPYGGKLVQSLLDRFPGEQSERVMAAVRSGVVSGQTNAEIIKTIRGTKALNYEDGIAQITRGSADMFVRTARNHVSNQAMADTYERLGVRFVVFVATLDGRTSKVCAGLDGRRWKIDEPHPTPPLHPRCRSILAPSMDGDLIGQRPYVRALKVTGRDGDSKFRSIRDMTTKQRKDAGLDVGRVAATTDYGKWFGKQDAEFQRQWLGQGRYKLFKEGGYTIDRFSDPRTGKQYTLDELRARDEETFRQVFG